MFIIGIEGERLGEAILFGVRARSGECPAIAPREAEEGVLAEGVPVLGVSHGKSGRSLSGIAKRGKDVDR